MAKKPRKKPEKAPPKRGDISIEACYVGELRDKQKIEGKKNKHAWPRGRAADWRENPEKIPEKYWYKPILGREEGRSATGGERISRRVLKKARDIQDEAMMKGWLESWLFESRFWGVSHPITGENARGLVTCLDDKDEICEVTSEYIAIKKSGYTSRFYAPIQAAKIREYHRRLAAGESVDDLVGKSCDKPLAKPPEPKPPREKVVTPEAEAPPTSSVASRFKAPAERKPRRVKKKPQPAKDIQGQEESEEASLF